MSTANAEDFERSDAPPWLIVTLGAGLTTTVVGLMVVLSLVFPQALADRPKGPVGPPPPQPRLQIAPRADLVRYETAEAQRLQGYGWTDRGQGRVHIPIRAATRDVAARGWKR